MLRDNDIDKLIQPVIDNQFAIEMAIYMGIARKIKQIKEDERDVYAMILYFEMEDALEEAEEEIQAAQYKQQLQVKDIIDTVAKDTYAQSKSMYEYRKGTQPDFGANKELTAISNNIASRTIQNINNFSKSTALGCFWTDPIVGTRTFVTLSQIYKKILDTAIQKSVLGEQAYGAAMSKTMQNLVSGGINTLQYQSDKGTITYQRLDTAVRRNLLDGIRDVNQQVQNEVGKQVGADGVEISVHAMSAPDHEPIQGHQFTNKEYAKCQSNQAFQDVNGNQFPAMERRIGVWNCRHFAWNIIIGVNSPTYTQEQLNEFITKNNKGYTYTDIRGKKHHMTMYECTQRQRAYELDLRRAKEGRVVAKEMGDTVLMNIFNARVYTLRNHYQAFSEDCGLQTHYERTRVYV